MTNKSSKLYISDITEAERSSPSYGDVEVLIAGEKDVKRKESNEKIGNQSKEYYQD